MDDKERKEKRKVSQARYKEKNIERIRAYQAKWKREWRKKNREEYNAKMRQVNKEYYQANKEKVLESCKKSYTKHREARLRQMAITRIKHKVLWLNIIKEKGMHICSKCGYSNSFAAIDLHHVKPEEKESLITAFFKNKPTPAKIAELDKCIALCANCHRETHQNNPNDNGVLYESDR